MSTKNDNPLGYIFRTFVVINGIMLHAHEFGKRAFRIPIYSDQNGKVI